MIFWLVLKLEISYYRSVIIYVEGFWFLLEDFFEDYIFAMVKYLNFHNSSFALRYLFNVNGKATVWDTPCFVCLFVTARSSKPWGFKIWVMPSEWGVPLIINPSVSRRHLFLKTPYFEGITQPEVSKRNKKSILHLFIGYMYFLFSKLLDTYFELG
jgi:hypothetical protein